jgi:hypothetical protein
MGFGRREGLAIKLVEREVRVLIWSSSEDVMIYAKISCGLCD